jgi:hypothetical protein
VLRHVHARDDHAEPDAHAEWYANAEWYAQAEWYAHAQQNRLARTNIEFAVEIREHLER